jgi:hypothetical protein
MSTPIQSKVDPDYVAKAENRKSTVSETSAARHAEINAAFAPLKSDFDKRRAAIASMPGSRKKKMAAFLDLVDIRAIYPS